MSLKKKVLKSLCNIIIFYFLISLNGFAIIEPGDPGITTEPASPSSQPTPHTCTSQVCTRWFDSGIHHSCTRSCTQCGRQVTTTKIHEYNAWSAWNSMGVNHTRFRKCTSCSHTESETAAHNFSAWSTWEDQVGNHTRFRICSTCGRKESETRAHSYCAWSDWSESKGNSAARNRQQVCSACNHVNIDKESIVK